MGIDARLERLVEQVPGALASSLVDEDGLTVSSYRRSQAKVDFEALSAEVNLLLARAGEASSELGFGALRQLAVATDRYHIFSASVGSGYSLLLIMEPDAATGKGRFYMKRTAFSLRAEV